MKKIVVVYDGSFYTYKWVKTLMWAKKQFSSRGYDIQYVNFCSFFPIGDFAKNQIDNLFNRKKADVIMLAFHHSISKIKTKDNLDTIEILKLIRNKCDCLVWLDTADSTGTTQFEVMPYVDYYLKKQILRDKNLYCQHHYGQRIYLDYYHQKYNLDDPDIDNQYTLLNPQYFNKLRVSWNIGLADIWRKGKSVVLSPFSIKSPIMYPADGRRTIDVFFNGTIKYSNLTSFQRKLTCEIISKDIIRKHPDPLASMSHEEYIDCMRSTKIALSPFGWGEVCYRDFETIAYGAMLIKPSVEHMYTYPDLYVPNETYIPIDWDYTDYDDVMSRCGSKEYFEIAKNAQSTLSKHISTQWGKEDFVNHLLEAIS